LRTSPSAVYELQEIQQIRRQRKKRRRSPTRHAAEFFAFRFFTGVIRLLPRKAASALLGKVGLMLLAAARTRRRILLENLARAFPDKPRSEILRIARDSVQNSTSALLDFLDASDRSPEELLARVDIAGEEHLRAARARGKGVFLLSAHFGSWEIGAMAAGLLGEPIALLVRPLDNPLLEADLKRRRTCFGNRVISKREAARELLRAMRHKEAVAILVDQNVLPQEAVFVPFFGRLAATTPSLALLQMKTDAAVVPVFTWPLGAGRYRLRFEEPILCGPEDDAPRAEKVRRMTARYMQVTEEAIREDPTAWLWLHDRWKTRPPGV
jgi:KDO2-lipid IV(A) lauroyltransferase